jgi:hypothetical protein
VGGGGGGGGGVCGNHERRKGRRRDGGGADEKDRSNEKGEATTPSWPGSFLRAKRRRAVLAWPASRTGGRAPQRFNPTSFSKTAVPLTAVPYVPAPAGSLRTRLRFCVVHICPLAGRLRHHSSWPRPSQRRTEPAAVARRRLHPRGQDSRFAAFVRGSRHHPSSDRGQRLS